MALGPWSCESYECQTSLRMRIARLQDVASLYRLCLCSPGMFPLPPSLTLRVGCTVLRAIVCRRARKLNCVPSGLISAARYETRKCAHTSESVECERDACGQRGVRTAKYAVRTARNAQSQQGPSQSKTSAEKIMWQRCIYSTCSRRSGPQGPELGAWSTPLGRRAPRRLALGRGAWLTR